MTTVPAARPAPSAPELQLGPRIRALRRARNITLRELADRAGVTESFLSQVEREVTSPSIASVQRIARGLDLSIAELFTEDAPHGRVVRRADRRRIAYQGLGAVDEFLTAGLEGRLQVILSTIEPGGGTGDEAYAHDSDEEVVIVLSGRLELWVADERHVLEEGDTITYASRLKHRNRNIGDTTTVVLFCVTPPSF
jgi:transcriptional regulator with XRE-family HTH domain